MADLLAAATPTEPRTGTDLAALRRAHEALARTVAPAKPQSLALLYALNRNRHHLVFPIRLVRVMLGVAGALLVVFLGSVLLVAREASGTTATTETPTLYGLLYIVSAAGLGAAFYALFTATRYANQRTYDEKYESYYWTRFGLGIVGGTLLAVLLRDWEPLATADLTAPILALVGGFSADVVHRVLRRIVETIDALLRGEQEPDPAPEVTATTERERLVLNLVERERALRDLDKIREADAIHDQILAVDAGTASVSPNGEAPKPAP